MMLHSRLLACLAALCFTAAAADKDPWVKITSVNFELYTTAGERAGRDLIRHFEQVRSFFLQAFGAGLPNAKPVRIVAFRSEKEYEPYRLNEFATAYFHPGISHDFIVMSNEHPEVATHEFTHLMVHQGGAQYPVWLNEGLAELFSNLQPVGNKIKVGQDIPGRMTALRAEKWIPLATLLGVDHNSPYYNDKSKAGMFYAESWELVHMLFLHPAYASHLKTMSSLLKQQDPPSAFQSAYHKPIFEIEKDLHTYLSGATIKVFLFDIQLPKNIDAPQIEPASGMSARLALAEMFSDSRTRSAQARAAYESIAKDFPARWEVEDGLAQYAYRERKLDDAARHYARALELGCQDSRMMLAYGRVLLYLNRTADAAGVLAKAAALDPDPSETRLELGALYVRTAKYEAALNELRAIKRLPPAQTYRYYYNQAYAEYRLGQIAEAKQHATRAREYTHNPAELATLDRLERSLTSPAPRKPDPDTAEEAPRITRRADAPSPETPPAPAAPALPALEGTFEAMDCGALARLHVRAEGKVSIFVIPDPRGVTIRNGNGQPIDLQCGPQKPPRPVRIEYQPSPAASGTAGIVRALEFK
jgi:tetratricopeptide (TPR) repeat protein